MAGLYDEPRPGAPRQIGDDDVAEVVRQTLETTPRDATHWSLRSMAKAAGFAPSTIHRIWKAFNLQPHRTETFKLSTDPCLSRRCAILSACTCRRPNARSFCASTRRARSRRWIGLSRCFSCARDKSSGAPTTIRAPWNLDPVRGSGRGDRQGHRALLIHVIADASF